MSEPISEAPANPSRITSFLSKARERMTPNRPHPDVTAPPEEYFKTPDHKYPVHGPGKAAYEFSNADWSQWLESTLNTERVARAQEFLEQGLQQGTVPTKEELKNMGYLAKAFTDGLQATFDTYRKSGKLPAGQPLPSVFVGGTQGGNLAKVTADGERTILGISALRSYANKDTKA